MVFFAIGQFFCCFSFIFFKSEVLFFLRVSSPPRKRRTPVTNCLDPRNLAVFWEVLGCLVEQPDSFALDPQSRWRSVASASPDRLTPNSVAAEAFENPADVDPDEISGERSGNVGPDMWTCDVGVLGVDVVPALAGNSVFLLHLGVNMETLGFLLTIT